MASYERFTAWKLSYELALKVYEATDSFPRSELYGLTSQVRRAAFSMVANLAEGAAKRGRREFRRYLDIALGSVTELQVALRLARDRGYLTAKHGLSLSNFVTRLGRLRGDSTEQWRDRVLTGNEAHAALPLLPPCRPSVRPAALPFLLPCRPIPPHPPPGAAA
jgi:four helix bundle protein